jgi:hypothetical protein
VIYPSPPSSNTHLELAALRGDLLQCKRGLARILFLGGSTRRGILQRRVGLIFDGKCTAALVQDCRVFFFGGFFIVY